MNTNEPYGFFAVKDIPAGKLLEPGDIRKANLVEFIRAIMYMNKDVEKIVQEYMALFNKYADTDLMPEDVK